jgi:hypothetical protein
MDIYMNKQTHMTPTINEDISASFQRMKAEHIRMNMGQQHIDEFTIQIESITTHLNQFLYNWHNDIFDVDTKCDLIQYFKSLDINYVPTTVGDINWTMYNTYMHINNHVTTMSDDDIKSAFQKMETDNLQLKMQRQKHIDEFTTKLDASSLYINKFMDKWNNTTIDIKCDLIQSFNSMYSNIELHAQEMCAKKSKRNQ